MHTCAPACAYIMCLHVSELVSVCLHVYTFMNLCMHVCVSMCRDMLFGVFNNNLSNIYSPCNNINVIWQKNSHKQK